MQALKPISLLATLAAISLLALSGCGAGNEASLASAVAHSPATAWLFEGLKHDDDEVDARESIEHRPQSREEAEEAHEAAEQAQAEAAPEAEGESG